MPVPDNATVCGLVTALSATLSCATREPFATGVKVTLTVQLEPAVSVDPQVVVLTAKSPLIVPARVMPEMARVPGSLFLIVTILAALVFPTLVAGKFKLEGVTVTGRIPVPVKLTDCGLLLALSVMASVADLAPTAPGVKTTLTVQVRPAPRVPPHVVPDLAKSLAFAPVKEAPESVKAVGSLFLIVTVFAALVVPTVVAGNFSAGGSDCDRQNSGSDQAHRLRTVAGAISNAQRGRSCSNRSWSKDNADGAGCFHRKCCPTCGS